MTHFEKQEPQRGISSQWSASRRSLTGQTFACRIYYRPQGVVFCPCVPETVRCSQFVSQWSCLGLHIGCPNSNKAFPATTWHQNRICSTEHEDYLYLYQKRVSLPLCFQGTTVCDDCACVGVWGVSRCRLATAVWFSRWHTGTWLASAH